MTQLVGFGNGSDGILNITTPTTDAPVDSTFSGTGASSAGSGATGKTFAAGDIVLIHYSRGASAGIFEVNQIDSYNSGTGAFAFVLPLANTYVDSGADQSQIIRVPQYSNVNISGAGTLTAKAWDGNVGGILVFMCAGKFVCDGTLTASSKGFRGGSGTRTGSPSQWGRTGESHVADIQALNSTANYFSAGGAGNFDGGNRAAGGGGGSHAFAGQNGTSVGGGNFGGGYQAGVGGTGGQTILGNSELTLALFGGGGGSSVYADGTTTLVTGGNGGGGIFLFCRGISGTGTMSVAGGVGENGASSPNRKGAGGGGAAGFIKIWCVSMQFSGTLNASGGVGGAAGDGLLGAGGNGSDGRIAIYSCSNTQAYASNPGPYMSTGGFAFCSNNNQII